MISWLPRKLAPQVRCVLTMINGTAVHQALIARETKPIEVVISPLDIDSRKVRHKTQLSQWVKYCKIQNIAKFNKGVGE